MKTTTTTSPTKKITTKSTPTKKIDASAIARIAYQHHMPRWQGFGGDARGFYLFSNAPCDMRPRLLAELTEHMKVRGCELASSGFYPAKGEEAAGHTVALVFAPSPHNATLEDLIALRVFYEAAAIRMFPGQCGYPNGTVHYMGTALELAATPSR